jgi:hypothetical protein
LVRLWDFLEPKSGKCVPVGLFEGIFREREEAAWQFSDIQDVFGHGGRFEELRSIDNERIENDNPYRQFRVL